MSLRVHTRIPYGNAADVEVVETGDMPEVRFTPDPCDGPDSLWFCFRLVETDPKPEPPGKVRLVLRHFDNLAGAGAPGDLVPAAQNSGQGWARLRHGEERRTADGRREVTWQLPHPAPWTEVALSFPYGPSDLDALLDKTRDYWQHDLIGVNQSGRGMARIANAYGAAGGNQPGLYAVARQHAADAPGSWVLDGLLRHFAQIRKAGYVVWAAPLADSAGVMRGAVGRRGPDDLDRAWGAPLARHEAGVIAQDLRRWKERCKPLLVLDLQAPGACDKDGVFAHMPAEGEDAAIASETVRWANLIQNELKAEFAAADFKRAAPAAGSLAAFVRNELKIPALRLHAPFALAGTNVLTVKSYREIGRRLAEAVFHRRA